MADEREGSVQGSGGMFVRVNELARELEVKPAVVLALLAQFGDTQPKTHSSSISPEDARKIQEYVQSGVPLPAPKPVPALRSALSDWRTPILTPPSGMEEDDEEEDDEEDDNYDHAEALLREAARAESSRVRTFNEKVGSIKDFSVLCSQELESLPRRVPEDLRYAVTAYAVVSLHGMLDRLLTLIDPVQCGEKIPRFETRNPTMIEQMEALIELAGKSSIEKANWDFVIALRTAHETRKAIAHPTKYNKPKLNDLASACALLYVVLNLCAIDPEAGYAGQFPTTLKELSVVCSKAIWDLLGDHSFRDKEVAAVLLP